MKRVYLVYTLYISSIYLSFCIQSAERTLFRKPFGLTTQNVFNDKFVAVDVRAQENEPAGLLAHLPVLAAHGVGPQHENHPHEQVN